MDNSLRIRLPPPEVIATLRPQSAPRMTFGKNVVPVRPKPKGGLESSVDLMLLANTGQKYTYATKKGRNGQEGDLEKGKKAVRSGGRMNSSIEIYYNTFDINGCF